MSPYENKDQRESGRQFEYELAQITQYYFLDKNTVLQKAKSLPEDITDFVWESRETLNAEEILFTLAHVKSYETHEAIITNHNDLQEDKRTAIAGTLLNAGYSKEAKDRAGLEQVIRYYFLDDEGGLQSANELPTGVGEFVWESREPSGAGEFQFTIAHSAFFHDQEKLIGTQENLKVHEREEIARALLGCSRKHSCQG